MSRSGGFTLWELLVVQAIVTVLAGLLVPSFASVRQHALLVGCAAGMHDIHQALMGYAVMQKHCLPPFSFSSYITPSLAVSGHWGGISQENDPAAFVRNEEAMPLSVNLWTLVDEGYVPAGRLICPAADSQLHNSAASYFPYTLKFSTYCLRFPYSDDLFRESPKLAYFGPRGLLEIYFQRHGGERVPVAYQLNGGRAYQTVPLVRIDRRYRIASEVADCVAGGDGEYDVAADVLLSDGFWWQDRSQETPPQAGLKTYPIRSAWSHGRRFNTLTGDGAVRTVTDRDGTVRANSNAQDQPLDADGLYDATYAERVWQFFDKFDTTK